MEKNQDRIRDRWYTRTHMKTYLRLAVLLAALSFASPAVRAEEPMPKGDVRAKMSVFPDRGKVTFSIINANTYPVIVNFRPGPKSTVQGLKNGFIAMNARSVGTQEFDFTLDPSDRDLAIDYEVDYRQRDAALVYDALNPPQYFVRASAGWKSAPLSVILAAKLRPTAIRRDQIREERYESGAGYVGTTRLQEKSFPVEADTYGDEGPEYVRLATTMLPKQLSEVLPVRALPRSEGIVEGPVPAQEEPSNKRILGAPYTSCFSGERCVRGRLRFKETPTGTPAALWGWTVYVWDTSTAGQSTLVSITETDVDGYWGAYIPDLLKLRSTYLVAYESINRAVEIRNPATGNPFQWTFTVQRAVENPSVIQGVTGINMAFTTANQAWIKLASVGINSLSKAPVPIYYPNYAKCPGHKDAAGNPIPWSCSDGSNVYLAESGTARTVGHELGHVLNFMFWGKFPAGSGGVHYVDQCYTPGLALSEGFAEFFESWVPAFDRIDLPVYRPLEYYQVNCASGGTGNVNELAVAATFWDLYDTRSDNLVIGQVEYIDSIYMKKEASVISEFLSASGRNSMIEMHGWFKARYPTHVSTIDTVFKMNRTDH